MPPPGDDGTGSLTDAVSKALHGKFGSIKGETLTVSADRARLVDGKARSPYSQVWETRSR